MSHVVSLPCMQACARQVLNSCKQDIMPYGGFSVHVPLGFVLSGSLLSRARSAGCHPHRLNAC
jgi:hypothetical protein